MDKVNKEALEQLKGYRDQGCHMLVPCMANIADVAAGFRIIVTPVQLRPHPKDKDVYPHETGTFEKNDWKCHPDQAGAQLVRIAGQGLEKLAQNVKIEWSSPVIRTDPNTSGDHLRQLCEIAGAVRMPDGYSFYRVPDCYGMDLEIEMSKIIQGYSYNGKFDEKKQWMVDRDFLQKKVNQTKLCISGAKNRVIRKLLGIDTAYTVASLSKPFVAVRVIPWLDMEDEYTRKLVIQMNVKQMAIANLFGGVIPESHQIEGPPEPPTTFEPIPPEKCVGDVVEAEDPETPTPAQDDNPPFAMDPPPVSPKVDFENSDVAGQVKTIEAMIKEAGFDISGWLGKFKKQPATLANISPKNRLALYEWLSRKGEKAA